MSSDDEAPVDVPFAKSRSDAQSFLRTVKQAVADSNRRKREQRRERDQLNVAQKVRKLEKKRLRNPGVMEEVDDLAEADPPLVAADNMEVIFPPNPPMDNVAPEDGTKRSESDEGYNGSEEGCSALPDFIRARLLEDTGRTALSAAQSRNSSFRDSRLARSAVPRIDPQRLLWRRRKAKLVP